LKHPNHNIPFVEQTLHGEPFRPRYDDDDHEPVRTSALNPEVLVPSRNVFAAIVISLGLTAGLLATTAFSTRPPQAADPDTRPIAALDSVFIEEMTWMEVRDAMKEKTTVIIPTGGVEQNGPYIATGKHNYILRATTDAIARKLGNALVAPIVPFVPEGAIDPPTGHMKYPGTISLTEDTYQCLLIDICASFRTHGFRDIVLIGDSGGNQKGMKAVAAELNKKWAGGKTRVHFIPEYYNHDAVDKWLAEQGIKEVSEGIHDSFNISATLAAIDPTLIRAKQRQTAKKFSINGVDLAPLEKTVEWGKKIIGFRAEATVKAVRKATAELKP
jgi:creatinine amidohydrolase/Fe(II)-dependent formamide hydrolase-like protein